jgi:YbbR domain-containing protein
MALILAIILWGFAYMENQEELEFPCKVLCTAPEGVRLTVEKPEFVLSVRGARRLVEAYRNQPSIVIKKQLTPESLANLPDEGRITLQVTREDLDGDKRLTFSQLPVSIPVKVSRETVKDLELRLRTTGDPMPGYVFSDRWSYVRPLTVRVTGPKSILDKPGAVIYTKPVELTNLYGSGSWDTEVVPTIDSQPVSVEPTSARVYIVIDRKLVSRTLTDVPVRVLSPQDYPYKVAALKPSTVSITVEGPEESLAALESTSPGVSVFAEVTAADVPQLQDLAYGKKPRALLPEGVRLVSIDPTYVDVTISQP